MNLIQTPNLSNGQEHLVLVGQYWHAIYYLNGKRSRRSLRVTTKAEAKVEQKKFYKSLNVEVYSGSSIADKIKRKPSIYIYQRLPFLLQIEGKVVGEFKTRSEAKVARDNYFKI